MKKKSILLLLLGFSFVLNIIKHINARIPLPIIVFKLYSWLKYAPKPAIII